MSNLLCPECGLPGDHCEPHECLEAMRSYSESMEKLAYWGMQLYQLVGQEKHEFKPPVYEALNAIGYFTQEVEAVLNLPQNGPKPVLDYIEKKLSGQL